MIKLGEVKYQPTYPPTHQLFLPPSTNPLMIGFYQLSTNHTTTIANNDDVDIVYVTVRSKNNSPFLVEHDHQW
jgi:hypothetical protein